MCYRIPRTENQDFDDVIQQLLDIIDEDTDLVQFDTGKLAALIDEYNCCKGLV